MINSTSRSYPLRKCRHIMKWVYGWYRKKGKQLTQPQLEKLENEMSALDQALLAKQRPEASQIAQRLEEFAGIHCKKSILEYIWELVLALTFALVIAVLVRAMWFEPYEIPTGSMRPTFREQDHLIVTKTAFGINMPLATEHLYFNPELVERTGVVIFSGDGLPLREVDTTYFGLFPYKKRYIKRLMAKPGDAVYFYGGKIYAVDGQNNDLKELREAPWMQTLEHVPFLSFEGDMSGGNNFILFNQMHKPAGKLSFNILGQANGEVFNGKEWIKDQPLAQTKPHTEIQTYSDLLGMRNYAEARLLTKEELKNFPEGTEGIEEGVLYLQLHHTPSLTYPKPLIQRSIPGGIAVTGYITVIPLQKKHLDAIMNALYTARFVVTNGKATSYHQGNPHYGPENPSLPGVPDGTYEFYFGKATQIKWGGIPFEVAADNPLYSHDAANVQRLFNLGIELNIAFAPGVNNQSLFPHRYAYFRDGDLYLMGAPILKKDDPLLLAFNKRELERQNTSSNPYVAFKDYGPPLKQDGSIDAEFIRTFGMTMPPKQYLVLGDNHAMSADSRVFGTVPEENLQGAPCWIIWPPGDRLGAPQQKPYPFMNVPRAIVWSIAGLIFLVWFLYHRYSIKQPIFKKKVF